MFHQLVYHVHNKRYYTNIHQNYLLMLMVEVLVHLLVRANVVALKNNKDFINYFFNKDLHKPAAADADCAQSGTFPSCGKLPTLLPGFPFVEYGCGGLGLVVSGA
jgi:hypothetical protein